MFSWLAKNQIVKVLFFLSAIFFIQNSDAADRCLNLFLAASDRFIKVTNLPPTETIQNLSQQPAEVSLNVTDGMLALKNLFGFQKKSPVRKFWKKVINFERRIYDEFARVKFRQKSKQLVLSLDQLSKLVPEIKELLEELQTQSRISNSEFQSAIYFLKNKISGERVVYLGHMHSSMEIDQVSKPAIIQSLKLDHANLASLLEVSNWAIDEHWTIHTHPDYSPLSNADLKFNRSVFEKILGSGVVSRIVALTPGEQTVYINSIEPTTSDAGEIPMRIFLENGLRSLR